MVNNLKKQSKNEEEAQHGPLFVDINALADRVADRVAKRLDEDEDEGEEDE